MASRPDRVHVHVKELLTLVECATPPVDVERIAEKLGIRISYEPFGEELSGVLVKEKSETVIGLNSSHSKTRQRFTIAHEIGHLRLGHAGEIFVDQTVQFLKRDARSALAVDPHEIEANRFAAELLMPEDFVFEAVEERVQRDPPFVSGALVEELARLFRVSPQAMEYRLTNLGLFIPQ